MSLSESQLWPKEEIGQGLRDGGWLPGKARSFTVEVSAKCDGRGREAT